MKKTLWLGLILLIVCVFAFSSCDSGDTPQTPNDTPSGTTDNTTESETDAHVHAFGEWTTVKDATCTVKGEQERSCSCGEKENKSIDATGHTEVIDAAVAATCTTDGKTEGKHCSVCNEILIPQKLIYATGSLGLSYEFDNSQKGYYVKGLGTCQDSQIYIPEYYNGHPVVSIGKEAFYNCFQLQSVTIGINVQQINEQAFYGCLNLKCVEGGQSVTRISKAAFYNCSNLKSFSMGSAVEYIGWSAFEKCTSLTDVTIPDSVTKIDYYAFMDCSSITNLSIGKSVENIGDFAFWGCAALTYVVIPDNVLNIGRSAFSNCLKLSEIYIGKGVRGIDQYAFANCPNVEKISVNQENQTFHSVNNCVINTNKKELVFGCKESLIPQDESVTSIGYGAFYGCTLLESISIPEGVVIIDSRAFQECTKLKTITIPSSVIKIGFASFIDSPNIIEVNYCGTETDWKNIDIDTFGNDSLTNAYIVFAK